jgi:Zn finger protein HypA/HybF involved in hydrogenase expression
LVSSAVVLSRYVSGITVTHLILERSHMRCDECGKHVSVEDCDYILCRECKDKGLANSPEEEDLSRPDPFDPF